MSPTARSLAHLRKRGCIAQVVERFNPGARVRVDFLGCIDILALEPGTKGVLGIQCTTVANQAKRVSKILSEPRALAWIGADCRLEVWAWGKRGPRGRRKTWQLTVKALSARDWV